jgi:hypothetical protein
VEQINIQIRLIIRSGFGYHSPDPAADEPRPWSLSSTANAV